MGAMNENTEDHDKDIERRFEKSPKVENVSSDNEEQAKPAKKRKTKSSSNVRSRLPVDASPSPRHDNKLAYYQEYDSKALSPRVAGHRYANHWIDFKTMNPDDEEIPCHLARFLIPLLEFQKDKMIIPESLRDEIKANSEFYTILSMLDNDSYYKPDASEADNTKGLFDRVNRIVEAANKCHSRQYDETGWNNLVYTPLIVAAMESCNPKDPHLAPQIVDVAPW
ncbi:hypothetical protein H9Q70_006822 [Fusarium xylarioides]|nr:hypothetical protein H9Q70_006822 [Fusarium xylarioides]KAG5806965.1 hypothetical protein H9Q71_008468 [Fusarium xylarioides]KAG5821292.1 hypothetical protein H9Q74_008383 [Fusarium xylarioides]